ncbi:MAG: ATP-binding cassette domain-containing protein [Clostridia bacterium]|nr:ATP-binding cassette domain-containing protein [Clostridia bacterium]
MESIKIEGLSFSYPERKKKTLDNINLEIKKGGLVCLCGKSGCGKTTLLRLLKPELAPFGISSGNIFIGEKNLCDFSKREKASKIGFVMQNPDNQLVCDKVWQELSFGLESLGVSQDEIRGTVAEIASFFGIDSWFHKKVSELSGGQKQLLNLASVMAMHPSVLILDEPSSQLDPISSEEFFKVLEKINRETGTTIILSEHRLEYVIPISNRVLVMDEGEIIADTNPEMIAKALKKINHPMFEALPAPMRVYEVLDNGSSAPLSVRDGRLWFENFSNHNKPKYKAIPDLPVVNHIGETAIEFKEVYFRYDKNLPYVVKGLNLKIKKGEFIAILGGNGSGKTTTLNLTANILKPHRGKIYINSVPLSEISGLYESILLYLVQNPISMFVKKTVYLDLSEMLADKNITGKDAEEKIKNVSQLCRIEHLLQNHPYDLSGGELQRAALAKLLLKHPQIILLDEPTKGMDAEFKKEFARILFELKNRGITIIMVSHDIEFCAQYADRCALFFDGGIASIQCPREFFSEKKFYTTSVRNMSRGIFSNAIVAEDILSAFEKSEKSDIKTEESHETDLSKNTYDDIASSQSEITSDSSQSSAFKKLSKQTLISLALIFLTIPLTIFVGTSFFHDRKYYFISLIIIFQTILPFLMLFEKRKPQAREIVLVSILCAIAVGGRCAFFMLPEFKPTVAIIIITAVCFGGETGFLVGTITGFVSNFFFGQGPWTPWQMFALGIIGFLAGMFFKTGFSKTQKFILSIFGFLSAFFIYGGIMNISSVVMVQNRINIKMILASCLRGLPFDLIHSASTFVFLWLLSKPMAEKIEKIKLKYGLLRD